MDRLGWLLECCTVLLFLLTRTDSGSREDGQLVEAKFRQVGEGLRLGLFYSADRQTTTPLLSLATCCGYNRIALEGGPDTSAAAASYSRDPFFPRDVYMQSYTQNLGVSNLLDLRKPRGERRFCCRKSKSWGT